jgi:hypothetical protein
MAFALFQLAVLTTRLVSNSNYTTYTLEAKSSISCIHFNVFQDSANKNNSRMLNPAVNSLEHCIQSYSLKQALDSEKLVGEQKEDRLGQD